MWSPEEIRGQAGSRNASQALVSGFDPILRKRILPLFPPSRLYHWPKWEGKKIAVTNSLQARSDKSLRISSWGRLDIIQAYCHRSWSDFTKALIGRTWSWCTESLSLSSLCLALYWQQQNRRGNRKGLSSLVSGRISSFGGVPPPPSLNSPSPSLYLFLSFPPSKPILLSVWH